MAEIREVQRVLPFVGLIIADGFQIGEPLKRLIETMGKIVAKSPIISFSHTTYYNKEMGVKLSRQWLAFENLITPDTLVKLKLRSNAIEKYFLNSNSSRQINIDPGLLSLSNVVLASTKNYSHRIYLGQGIYGEVTLIFKEHKFKALEWTYPDYQEKTAVDFFSKAREILKKRLTSPLAGEE